MSLQNHLVKIFKCSDAGIKCHWSASAANETELLKLIKEHAGRNHKINEIPTDIYHRVRAAIKNVNN